MTNKPPSINPADDGSLLGTMRVVLDKFLQGVDDMLPAKVLSFDREKNRALVQPLINMLTTDGTTVERAKIASVPVFQYSGGGFVINFPLKPGDIGWLKANDRDLSLFFQAGHKATGPNTLRKHSFEDAVFFPDVMRGWTINEDGLVIQTLSGNQCIAINDGNIKIISDAEVIIDAPLTTITGELRTGTESGGSATFGGQVTAEGDIVTNQRGGISLANHTHADVMPGGGNTGLPNP